MDDKKHESTALQKTITELTAELKKLNQVLELKLKQQSSIDQRTHAALEELLKVLNTLDHTCAQILHSHKKAPNNKITFL